MSVIDENWDYQVGLPKLATSNEYNTLIVCLRDEVLQQHGFKKQKFDTNEISRSHDEELKILVENNKQLRSDIDNMLEELNKQKNRYENYKKDQKLLSDEVKDTHEAYLMAKKYYKKYLKMYYTIESKAKEKQTIYLQFFTEVKKESELYSIRLLRDINKIRYELLETNPKITNFEKLKNTLSVTNDVPEVLCAIRQAFLTIKSKK